MSAIYDNWEKLVGAVLKKEQLWQLFHSDSISISSDSSGFSFSHPSASLDDEPVCFSYPNHGFGSSSPPNILVDDHSHVGNLPLPPPIKEAPPRKRDLKIEVPKIRIQDLSFSSECRPNVSRSPSSGVNSRGGGTQSKWSTDAEQRSYPLPLPPGAMSKSAPVSPTISAATSPSLSPPSSSSERTENVRSPKTCWKRGKLIGRGPLGNVYLGFNSEKGEMCAMKEAHLSADADMKLRARILEIDILLLSRMKHPNIVQYFGTEMVGDNFYIYLEYVSGGSIHKILQEYGKLGESAIRNYTQQILAGLAYLHSKNIVHGNIKAASIFVDPNGGVKLSSFFIEKHIAGKPKQSLLIHSPYWMAPEVIKNSDVHNSASDIWSLGCTILEMATSKPPRSQYKRVMAMFKVACQNELPEIPAHLSDVCQDFLRCCLRLNPLNRATASQLLEHPFVRSSSPLGKQLLVSSSSGYPVVTKSVKSEDNVYARSPRLLGSGEVVSHSLMTSKSSYLSRDIYTPRNISAPVSPVRSPILYQASPQQLKRQMSPPKSISRGNGFVQSTHPNQATFLQEASDTLPKQSKMTSPSYWDPNILQTVFRFS